MQELSAAKIRPEVLPPSVYEQELIHIVQKLPLDRLLQVLDFARYIRSRNIEASGFPNSDESEEDIIADEARWDAQFATTQKGLKKMADKVRADIRAGRTMPMRFTDDGRIVSQTCILNKSVKPNRFIRCESETDIVH
jgi:hypothetical protein